jgi:hypothetical protein
MASPHADCVAVLHLIEMDVIEMARKIVRVAQRMLPIPPPPNPALGLGGAAGRLWYLGQSRPEREEARYPWEITSDESA